MRSSRSVLGLAGIIAMASAGLGVAADAATKAVQTIAPASPRAERRRLAASQSWDYYQRRHGPGWSCAQVKRMAKKARNVRRNRRAHR